MVRLRVDEAYHGIGAEGAQDRREAGANPAGGQCIRQFQENPGGREQRGFEGRLEERGARVVSIAWVQDREEE